MDIPYLEINLLPLGIIVILLLIYASLKKIDIIQMLNHPGRKSPLLHKTWPYEAKDFCVRVLFFYGVSSIVDIL